MKDGQGVADGRCCSTRNYIDIAGLTYLQKIAESVTGGALHIEPGPPETASITRMGSIHTAIKVVPGGTFNISPVNTSPFKIGDPMPAGGTPAFPPITVPGFPEFNLAVPNNFRTPAGNTPPIPLPASIDGVPMQDVVNDPTRLLQQAIRGPFIEEMVVLQVATEVTLNAESAVLFATLWVEKVKHPAHHFMQLQYV